MEVAPSVCNRQGGRVYVMTSKAGKKMALHHQDDNGKWALDAGVVLILAASQEHYVLMQEERYQAWIDGGMWSQAVLMGLHSVGLGACPLNWDVNPARDMAMRRSVGIPPSDTILMLMAVGHYPDTFEVAASPRKPLADVLYPEALVFQQPVADSAPSPEGRPRRKPEAAAEIRRDQTRSAKISPRKKPEATAAARGPPRGLIGEFTSGGTKPESHPNKAKAAPAARGSGRGTTGNKTKAAAPAPRGPTKGLVIKSRVRTGVCDGTVYIVPPAALYDSSRSIGDYATVVVAYQQLRRHCGPTVRIVCDNCGHAGLPYPDLVQLSNPPLRRWHEYPSSISSWLDRVSSVWIVRTGLSRIAHHSSLITHPSSLIAHPSSRIPHPASRITHHASRITRHSSLVTRHSVTHSSSAITHYSLLIVLIRSAPCGSSGLILLITHYLYYSLLILLITYITHYLYCSLLILLIRSAPCGSSGQTSSTVATA